MAGKQWERGGEWHSSVQWVNKQQQQHVSHSSRSGWDGSRAKKEKEKKKKTNARQWVRQALPVVFSCSYPLSVVPSSALLFALAGCRREGPLRWCLCNLLGNFLGPSDLSLLEILSPFCPGQVITFREVVHMAWEYNKKKTSIPCKSVKLWCELHTSSSSFPFCKSPIKQLCPPSSL